MLSKPEIIAILVALCIAVIHLSLRIAFWIGSISAKKLRASNPRSIFLSWVPGALYIQSMAIGAVLLVPLWLGAASPSGTFWSVYFGEIGWPSFALVLLVIAASEFVSRVFKNSAYSRGLRR